MSKNTKNEQGKRNFAFFDLDHTLLPYDTQILFGNFVIQRERWRMLWPLWAWPFILLALISRKRELAKRAFFSLLWKMPSKKVNAYATEFAKIIVEKMLYKDIMRIINYHKKAKDILVLNSASPNFYAHKIADLLNFDYCYASPLKVNFATGIPLLPPLRGSNNIRATKIERMRDLLEINSTEEAFCSNSCAYSDSSNDMPLLKIAEHRFLVNPSSNFLHLAKREFGEDTLKVLRPPMPHSGKTFKRLRELGDTCLAALGLLKLDF